MCRFLFAYRRVDAVRLEEWLARLERPFHDCRPELSYGIVGLHDGRRVATHMAIRSATPPACNDERLADMARPLASYSPLLVHMRKRVGAGDSKLENTHPFVWGDRYVFMHNGRIPTAYPLPAAVERQIRGQTDSERFLALWMSLLKAEGSLLAALRKALAVVEAAPGPSPLINLVLLDKATGEFIVYRGLCPARAMPAVYVDGRAGLVANFRLPGAAYLRKGQVLHRVRWGARAEVKGMV